jgi:hypothetical protein
MPAPDDTVASRIIEELRDRDLVPRDRLASLEERLAGGSLSSEDWALMVELALDESSGAGRGRPD